MQVILSIVWSYFLWFIRPLYKWFLRKTTRLTELQRVCYGNTFGAKRTLGIEDCLINSRTTGIIDMVKHLNKLSDEGKFHGREADYLVENAVAGITLMKKIDCRLHMPFIKSMDMCFHQILGYRQLIYEVEAIRKIPYNSENPSHEDKLLHLWKLLQPEIPLSSRITKQWGDIGFQGDDPKTDFRGMGMLGLENLLYFATEYNGAARHVISHSHHPSYGYSFAIVGINLTSVAHQLLMSGALKVHLYNSVKGKPEIHHFHQFYSYLFYEFDKFWLSEKPKDIMEFNNIRGKFVELIQSLLQNQDTFFRIKLSVDTI